MSTYTHRYVEILHEQINGYRWNFERLPDPEEHVGEIYKINEYNLPEGVSRYYESVKETNDTPAHWDPRESVKTKWEPVKWYFEKRKIDNGGPYPGEEKFEESVNRFEAVDKFGKKHLLQEDFMWCNNGGYIRNDYIGRNIGNRVFQDRGLPSDVSPEVKKDVESDYHYGMTYVLLSEWEKLFETELESFAKEVKKRFRDEKIDKILEKLDSIFRYSKRMIDVLDEMRHKLSDPLPDFKEKKKTKKDKEEDEWWEDSVEYMFEEEIFRLFNIREEIDRCEFICENLGDCFPSSDKVRIIYYLA